jgi:peroxiredoxin Q/BCP
MGTVNIGDVAPDFRLPGMRLVDGVVQRRDFQLSGHRGAPVVLAFYPLDASAICTKQLCEYQDEFDGFEALGAEVWAISMQDVASHERFARSKELSFPLLADERHGVADAYGATMMNGLLIRRSVFIIDQTGILRWKYVAPLGFFGYRGAEELRQKILEIFASPTGERFALPAPDATAFDGAVAGSRAPIGYPAPV